MDSIVRFFSDKYVWKNSAQYTVTHVKHVLYDKTLIWNPLNWTAT